eukprot:Sspe_Gene.44889::Locus_22090_Transcript_1_1_Confidence_0.750_Length_3051::g.44889::m.44889
MERLLGFVLASLTVAGVGGSVVSDLLGNLTFLNEGVVTSSMRTTVAPLPTMYLEPENVSKAEWAWAATGSVPYVFDADVQCKPQGVANNTDMPGHDHRQVAVADWEECAKVCCADVACVGWVHGAAPASMGGCVKGEACCYLKNDVGTSVERTGLRYGLAGRVGVSAPPTGIRSAPPLGGLAAGTVELRGDGTFTAVTMENNNPAGSAKLPVQPEMAIGAWVASHSTQWGKVLQTKPPSGVPGVDGLHFGGEPPVTRLAVEASPIPITLYGYSRLASVGDNLDKLHHPAVAFSLVFNNTLHEAVDVAAFMNLPAFAADTGREGTTISRSSASSPAECLAMCATHGCASWNLANGQCELYKDAPYYHFEAGAASGTVTQWTKGRNSSCLTLNKPGEAAMNGNYTLCGVGGTVSMATGVSLAQQWSGFVNGSLGGAVRVSDAHGAVAVQASLKAGEVREVTVVMGYFFPHHDYLKQRILNGYTRAFRDSEESALRLADGLVDTLHDVHALHDPVLRSTLPQWMSDTLIGSLHHPRSLMHFADGRWRQWEAYDCVNIDSVHNDGERHIPYIMLFPAITRNKLRGWGAVQQENGMIPEQLACGCMAGIDSSFEHGCGRVMSDCSSMYIVYILELLRWDNDFETLNDLYPIARKAAEWQISVSDETYGLPLRLQTTYDILALNRYNFSAYSSVFHIVAMRAMAALAAHKGRTDDVKRYTAAGDKAMTGLDAALWDEELKGYVAYNGGKALMADSFYAQVLAYSVGLGTVVQNVTRLRMHLETVGVANYDPIGLKILTGRSEGRTATEDDVWMMAPADHAALMLHTGMDTTEAMAIAERPYRWMRDMLRDTWNTPGVLRGNYSNFPGHGAVTSHYGYHMTVWHTALAVSGQQANLPNRELSFTPKIPAPYTLPVFLPGRVGTIEADAAGKHRFCLTTGSLDLTSITVDGRGVTGTLSLRPGNCVHW